MSVKKFNVKDIENLNHKYSLERENFYSEFLTIERYSLKKVVALRQYFEDKIVIENTSISEIIKIKKQLDILKNILNTPNSIEMRFVRITNDLIFERIVPYGRITGEQASVEDKHGRLFPLVLSMINLSRHVRYFLFNDTYKDFDLNNSYPSILANFANIYSLPSPLLQHYVKNRKDILNDLSKELLITRDQAKKLVIMALNLYPIKSDSSFLKEFSKEIFTIRKFMMMKALYHNSKGSNAETLYKTLCKRQDFQEKSLGEKMIMYQSFYCFNIESSLLLELRRYLNEKLNIKDIPSFDSSENKLHFIPFFDGAYILATSDNTKKIVCSDVKLKSLIDDFNLKHDYFNFSLKSQCIDFSENSYINIVDLSKYLRLFNNKDFIKSVNFSFDKSIIEPFLDVSEPFIKLISKGLHTQFNACIQKEIHKQSFLARLKFFQTKKSE